jgi:hypothetical protein
MSSESLGLPLRAVLFLGLLGGCGGGSFPDCRDPAYASECSTPGQIGVGGANPVTGSGSSDGGSEANTDGGATASRDGGVDAGTGAMDAGVFDAGP